MSAARPTLGDEWNVEGWVQFRQDQLDCIARNGESIGVVGCLVMADAAIERMEVA